MADFDYGKSLDRAIESAIVGEYVSNTPTLHPTLAGLLRAVCANPADDDVRLVLADWYEENGQEERGEFVRVQVELAATVLPSMRQLPADHLEQAKRYEALRRRERALLDAHARTDWLLALPPGLRPILSEAIYQTFRRGFVASVSSTLEIWRGQECPGMGCVDGVLTYRHLEKRVCQVCCGTGRTGAQGPALVQAAPIEHVTVSDRRPLVDLHGEYGWFRRVRNGDISGEESELPADLWKLLPGGFNRRDGQRGAGTWRDYPSQAEAQSALSHAAITWARQQAGLPALS